MKSFYKAGGILCLLSATPLPLYSIFIRRAFTRFLPCCIFLLLFGLPDARSQSPAKQEAVSGGEIRPLQVGDKVPEEFWTREHLFYTDGDTVRKNLEEYKGKLLILDFWATWCGSCIAAFPKINKLMETKRESVMILPVSYEDRSRVEKVFATNSLIQTSGVKGSVIKDEVLQEYFPHRIVPHYIWLDINGRVLFQTDASSLTEENIDSAIMKKTLRLAEKKDSISFDKNLPFDANQFKNRQALERTVFLMETPGVPSLLGQPMALNSDDQFVRAYAVNVSIERLYELAFPDLIQIPRNRKKIDGKIDAGLRLCYEFIGKAERVEEVRDKIKSDMDGFLGLISNLEKKDIDCYTLQINKEQYRKNKHLLPNERQTVSNWVRLVNNSPDNVPLICDFEPYKIFIPLLPTDTSYTETRKILNKYGIELEKDRREIAVFNLKERRPKK